MNDRRLFHPLVEYLDELPFLNCIGTVWIRVMDRMKNDQNRYHPLLNTLNVPLVGHNIQLQVTYCRKSGRPRLIFDSNSLFILSYLVLV